MPFRPRDPVLGDLPLPQHDGVSILPMDLRQGAQLLAPHEALDQLLVGHHEGALVREVELEGVDACGTFQEASRLVWGPILFWS